MYVIYPANEAINLTYEQFVLNEPNPKSDRVLTEEDIIQKYYPLATICCDLCDQSNRKTRSFDIMASLNTEIQSFHNLVHPAFNEGLKSHNTVTFKLLKTVADFSEQLSQVYEQHGEQLQLLVTNFRRRNNELYKERPSCSTGLFHLWELFLQEVENDSTASNEVALNLSRQVSRELLEGSFYRKIQSRKIFGHRESLETIITKTEDKLVKCRQEYKDSFMDYLANPDAESLTLYINTHNAYVQQLHATNGMLEEFNKSTIPKLLKELEDVYVDLCSMTCDAVYQCSDLISKRSNDQCKRYDTLSNQCRLINPHNDLLSFTKMTNSKVVPYNKLAIKRNFIPLQIPNMEDCKQLFISINERKIPIILKNELIIDKSSAVQLKPSYETLQNEANELENQIKQIQDSVENLLRVQQKSLESNLYNKVNELQENISVKSFDLYVAQIHLCAINSQKELFLSKLEINCETQQSMAFKDRKISISSNNTMKSKWMKALKSLKTTSPNKEADRKTAGNMSRDLKIDSDEHSFQEYTYKKITPCDICSQILRGHTRQGVRCKYCKFNVHMDCQSKVTSKCLPKLKLLKRQKSTSEIDYNIQDDTIPEDEYWKNSHISRNGNLKRRLFAGMKNLAGYGSKTHQNHYSVSLPEKKNSTAKRAFGEPLCLFDQNLTNIQRVQCSLKKF